MILPLADPLLPRVRKSTDWLAGDGELVRIETPPCGFSLSDASTLMLTATCAPWVNEVDESCRDVAVGAKVSESQLVTSTFASTLPRPLARS